MEIQITAMPKLFIGLDIHKKSWTVHFKTDISDHRGFTMPALPGKLMEYVSLHFPDHRVIICYESGSCGFSAARSFVREGWETVVINPADLPRIQKHQFQKTDRIDCRMLSAALQKNQLKAIHIPSVEQDELRSLVRHRNTVVKQVRQVKLQIKSMLLYHGVAIPEMYDNPNWSKAFQQWLHDLNWSHPPARFSLHSKLRLLQVLHKEYLSSANELRAYCRRAHKKDYYLLKSIPGIGGYLAAALIGELGDSRRFTNEDQFCSYIGLIPSIRNSGNTDSTMGITPRSKTLLRSYLIETAWVAIRLDPEIQAYYRRYFGKNMKSVIAKVAHKMAKRILSVVKNGRPYLVSHKNHSTLKPA